MIHALDPEAGRAAVERLFGEAADYLELESGPFVPAEAVREHFSGPLPPEVDPTKSFHLGLWDDGALLGLASTIQGFPEPADAFLGLLLMAPRARGRGEGRRLLRAVEAGARARGAPRLLVAVLDANPRGRAFWDREGFRPLLRVEGRQFGPRVHDVTRMAKPL